MTSEKLLLYLHTGRHIKPRQLAYFALRRSLPGVKTLASDANPQLREGISIASGINKTCEVAAVNEFRFLNISKAFDPESMDWASPELSKLWRYNLHYFDYVHDPVRSEKFLVGLLDSWIEKNPVGTEDAWEPFTVSLRIVNWVKLFLRDDFRAAVKETWLRSLYQQALWLEKNIEYHLLANHYFKNGKALVFAGLYFQGTDADRWLKIGLKILAEELEEQILADGGHFERSAMYHAMVLEDCLDVLNLGLNSKGLAAGGWRLVERLKAKCQGMVRFLLGMRHPDGQISLFNDAAIGIEALPLELAEYYERLTGETAPIPDGDCWSFTDTGYYVMAPDQGTRLLIDCGSVGPDYQPGHSHCDTLSFELSLKGRRVIVDSGCAQYVDGDIRRYNRGNQGHNTLSINGENQSEVWGAHRCARRARPLDAKLEKKVDGSLQFSGAHDGYRRLQGSPVHRRSIIWHGDSCLIEDSVEGAGRHDLESRLHIHPSLAVECAGEQAVIRDGDSVLLTISVLSEGTIEKNSGWYCPEFGVQEPCAVLSVDHNQMSLPFNGGWLLEIGK